MNRWVIGSLLLVAMAVSVVHAADETAQQLEDRIRELRADASYAEAAELALELLTLKESDPGTRAYEISDAERLAELLDTVAGLPGDLQRELAEADSMADVLMPLWDAARYAEGIEVARRQLGIRRRILGELNSDVSESLSELGSFLWMHGSFAEAESQFRQEVAINRAILGDWHPDLALSLSNQGLTLHYNRGDVGAEPLLREALAIQREVLDDDHADLCFSLNNLALVLIELGEYAEAESLLRRSLAIRRRDLPENHRELPSSLYNLATLLGFQGDDADAELLYLEALAAARRIHGAAHPEVADVLNGLGVFFQDRRRYEESGELLREALEIKESVWGREHPSTVLTIMNLGSTLVKQDDYDNGEPLLREALASFRKLEGDEHPDVALALSSLSTFLRRRGRLAEAEQALSEAVEIRRKAFGEKHLGVAGFRHSLGLLLWWQGKDREAEVMLEAAAEGYEASRTLAGARMKRTTFRLQSPFRVLAAVRIGLGKPEEAWEATERGMGRSLADLMFAAQERDARSEKESRVDSIEMAVGRLDEELAAYARAAREDASTVAAERFHAARDRLLVAQAELSDLHQEMAGEGQVPVAESFPIERISASLGEHAAMVGWIDVPWWSDRVASWGYVIRSSGEVFWTRLDVAVRSTKENERFGYISTFKRDLASPNSALLGVERNAHELWNERMLPMLPALESVDELIVIPSGPVVDYPVESLMDQDGVLAGDRYSISYAPSATVYAWLRESVGTRQATKVGRSLLVGDPPFSEDQLAAMEQEERTGERIFAGATASLDSVTIRSVMAGNERMRAGLPRLPGTRSEVLGLTQVCPQATVLVGRDASEQALVGMAETGALGDFDVIHFATHALVDYDRPERSVLVLSQVGLPDPLDSAMAGTRLYDGLVSAGEITREWDLDADLVTLSACETARGRFVMGEGSVGFAHAFLESGARSVLVGLWKVEDEATALLMTRFYENLFGEYEDERKGRVGEAMSKAEALQEAKRWLREHTDEYGNRPYEHPYYWSAFVLIGDRS